MQESARRRKIDTSIRVISDLIIVNVSLLAAIVAKFMFDIATGQAQASGLTPEQILRAYAKGGAYAAGPLSAIALTVFTLVGFYSYGRLYQGRYKALVVAQAVSVVYLLFGFGSYFTTTRLVVPRGALLLAWLFTMIGALGARLWLLIWRRVHGVSQPAPPARARKPKQTVLVIGGAGYIGSALVPLLLESGWTVRVLDLMMYGDEPLAKNGLLDKITLHRADFRHIEQVVDAMRGVDALVHLGGIVGDPACALDEELTIDINLIATRMIAEVAKGLGIDRFVFASTCSVYGAADEILNERSRLSPVSLYARSKIASEVVLQRLADHTFGPVVLRFGTIYGLSGRTRFDLVVNLMTAKALTERKITIFGGDQWRPFVHVEDAARGVLVALEAPREIVANGVFNVGSDEENYRIREIAEIVGQEVPGTVLDAASLVEDQRNYRVSFARISRELGYRPKWTVRDGVRQVVEAFSSGAVEDYRLPKYSNVKYLTAESGRVTRPDSGWATELLNVG
jgi:nucleoside-diphosphate-sugar epimerase